MALFGRARSRPDRRPPDDGLADPVRHAELTVRLGSEWQLLNNRSAVLAVVNDPDRSYSVRSPDGYLLTQTDVTAGTEGLRIRDTRRRMIIADCLRTPGGIVVRVLSGDAANQRFVARALAPAVAEALTSSGPLLYCLQGLDRGELRDRADNLLASDRFSRAPSGAGSDPRGGLIYWSIRVEENPFPTSWLFALLLACEHLRR